MLTSAPLLSNNELFEQIKMLGEGMEELDRVRIPHSKRGFLNMRWTTDKKYMKQYRIWLKRWQFEYRNKQNDATPLLTFNTRLTKNR